jgi:hypothetical protein
MLIVVWAKNSHGAATAQSVTTDVVRKFPPVNTRPPAIQGPATLGSRLVADVGDWTSQAGAITYDVAWYRCDDAGCERAQIDYTRTWLLTQADLGKRMLIVVWAKNRHGAATAQSVATTVVTAS